MIRESEKPNILVAMETLSPFKLKAVASDFRRTLYIAKRQKAKSAAVFGTPTQKPVALGRYLIRLFTGDGDLVLDNAFGSGSFLVAAALEGRRFIGIEKNEEVHLFKEKRIDYMDVAKMRLAEVQVAVEKNGTVAPLYSDFQPHARPSPIGRRGMVDVDAVIREPLREPL